MSGRRSVGVSNNYTEMEFPLISTLYEREFGRAGGMMLRFDTRDYRRAIKYLKWNDLEGALFSNTRTRREHLRPTQKRFSNLREQGFEICRLFHKRVGPRLETGVFGVQRIA